MAQQTRAINKAALSDGQAATGATFADLIDSYLSLADSPPQQMQGPLGTPAVSAAAGEFGTVVAGAVIATGPVSAAAVFGTTLTVTGAVQGANGVFTTRVDTPVMSAATILGGSATLTGVLTMSTAQTATTAISTSAGAIVPTTAAGYILVTVSGRTLAMPVFEVP